MRCSRDRAESKVGSPGAVPAARALSMEERDCSSCDCCDCALLELEFDWLPVGVPEEPIA